MYRWFESLLLLAACRSVLEQLMNPKLLLMSIWHLARQPLQSVYECVCEWGNLKCCEAALVVSRLEKLHACFFSAIMSNGGPCDITSLLLSTECLSNRSIHCCSLGSCHGQRLIHKGETVNAS